MVTREIPEREWAMLCREFTHRHYGWPVTVESLQYDGKYRNFTQKKELEVISIHSENGNGYVAQIEVGVRSTGHQLVVIPHVSSIRTEYSHAKTDAGLEIISLEDGITIIRFHDMFSRRHRVDAILDTRGIEFAFAETRNARSVCARH